MSFSKNRAYGARMTPDERSAAYQLTLAVLRGEAERQLADVGERHANMHARATVAVAVAAAIGVGGGIAGGDVILRGVAGALAVAAVVFAVASLMLEKSPAADLSTLSEAERTLFLEGGAYSAEYRIWIDQLRTLRHGHLDLRRRGKRLNVSFSIAALALVVAVAATTLT